MRSLLFSICLMLITACGMQRITEETRDEVKQSNNYQREVRDELKRTSHLQILDLALKKLETVTVLIPPTRMIGPAKIFSEEATPEELIGQCHLYYVASKNSKADNRQEALQSFFAMSALAALAPVEKVEKVLNDQILHSGEYAGTAKVFAVVRYNFMRDFIFGPAVDDRELNLDVLRKVIDTLMALDRVRRHPASSQFAVKIGALGIDATLDSNELPSLVRHAVERFEGGISTSQLQSDSGKKLLKTLASIGN